MQHPDLLSGTSEPSDPHILWPFVVQPTGKVEGGATRIPLVVNVTRSGGMGVRAVLGSRSLLTAGQARTRTPPPGTPFSLNCCERA